MLKQHFFLKMIMMLKQQWLKENSLFNLSWVLIESVAVSLERKDSSSEFMQKPFQISNRHQDNHHDDDHDDSWSFHDDDSDDDPLSISVIMVRFHESDWPSNYCRECTCAAAVIATKSNGFDIIIMSQQPALSLPRYFHFLQKIKTFTNIVKSKV